MADHRRLTRIVFDALPAPIRGAWRPAEAGIVEEYCKWPDMWLNPVAHERIDPYQLVIDGIQFHYPPMSHPDYLYWSMQRPAPDQPARPTPVLRQRNEHWRFFQEGVTHYLRAIVDDLRAGRIDDAGKRLGILLHFFQDTHNLHALEGPWGTDCFVLDRLLTLPEAQTHRTALDLLSEAMRTEADIHDHEPFVEGVSVEEAVCRLYQRYVDAALANRRLHVPLVQAIVDEQEAGVDALFRDMHERLARLSMDVIATVTALALEGTVEVAHASLRTVHLDTWEPTHRPWIIPGPYRFTAMVRGCCLDAEHERHPLALYTGTDPDTDTDPDTEPAI